MTTIQSLKDVIQNVEIDPKKLPFLAKVQDRLCVASSFLGPRSAFVDTIIDKLIGGGRLSRKEAKETFRAILEDNLSEDQIGSLLVLLLPDRLDAETIAEFAKEVRGHAKHIDVIKATQAFGDTCGTGSDAFGTFNVSTTIAFIIAANNTSIAKHGNRAVTSQCGSADVLEELGVQIDLGSDSVSRCIEEVGIGFIYAPRYHESFKNVARFRKLLAQESAKLPVKVRANSVFNILGPLSNPAGASWQIIGVYSPDLITKFAEILKELRVERALVPYGYCDGRDAGLDEFSIVGKTRYAELLDGGEIRTDQTLIPEDVGLERCRSPDEIKGGDRKENAKLLRGILSGDIFGAKRDLVLLNAGAGIYLGDPEVMTIGDGVKRAKDLVDNGAAIKKLDDFRDLTIKLERGGVGAERPTLE